MKVYRLVSKQVLPIDLPTAWSFFSTPANLGRITPPEMNFEILFRSGGEKMFAGQIIHYHVTVLPFVRLRWTTEITHVEDHQYFVDEQRFGPYALWHHRHHFREVEGGVEMTDEVHYAIPLGILGQLANILFVAKRIEGIFSFRQEALKKLFPG